MWYTANKVWMLTNQTSTFTPHINYDILHDFHDHFTKAYSDVFCTCVLSAQVWNDVLASLTDVLTLQIYG